MKSKVYLVGAGPGDYKLLTIKALECIKKADVIIYDNLVNKSCLREAKDGCELIYVGKKPNHHIMSQDKINNLLLSKAHEGEEPKIIVRLKGGDPYVFGRGAEEGEFLHKNNILFETVPGVTSAIAGLCYAGIPVTHRNHSSSFHVITGHLKANGREHDWGTLAKINGTLVFLMGARNLHTIVNNLIARGKPKNTPIAVVTSATMPTQKTVISTLEHICAKIKKEECNPPALIAIGDVVSLRDSLNFYERQPLFGKNIMVTRATNQNSEMIKKIADMGGNAIEVPTIKINKIFDNEELGREINNLQKYQYLIFGSANGVNIFFDKLQEMGYDSRILHGIKIGVSGSQTAKALLHKGIKADIVPKTYTQEALAAEIAKSAKQTDRILVPKAKKTRGVLASTLNNVTEVDIYETVMETSQKETVIQNLKITDYLTFTSSSAVVNFMELLGSGDIPENVKIVSIGPITSQTILGYNLEIYKEAEVSTIDSLLSVL
ncbi:MAG: uroporphyrinogen-III C-methyltransferase [Defluviitaleaceae bacterium]|nr:uroporphyrinogen-III C-methyltransferase [Defluviitaleaceae bacterium]